MGTTVSTLKGSNLGEPDFTDSEVDDRDLADSDEADCDEAERLEVDAEKPDRAREEADEESADEDAEEPAPSRSRWLATVLVGVALVFTGIAFGAVQFSSHRAAVAERDRDAQLLSTTREVAADLVTLRHDSADADVNRVRAHATGDFESQISDTTGSFSTILKQGQVDSEGKARQVAVVSSDDDHATTIAAVTSTVKNSETPQGQQRVYRMKLDLEQHDGQWLVSNVEFVS